MAMVVTVARFPSSSVVDITRRRARLMFNSFVSSSLSANFTSSASTSRKLLLYSKPGCCLCDGLKEKLHAAFSLSSPDPLHDVDLQIRDITSNVEWEKAYQYEIPVLARVLPDGTELHSDTLHSKNKEKEEELE